MNGRWRNAPKRPIAMLFAAVLVLLVASACGDDGDDEAADTTPTVAMDAESGTDVTAEMDGTPVEDGDTLAVATPAGGVEPARIVGTPVDGTGSPDVAAGGTPTPAIIVAAPSMAEPGTSASPAAGEPDTTFVDGAGGEPLIGDGTGGAVVGNVGEPGTVPEGTPQAAASGVVTSCDVASYPPYAGDTPSQFTTIDVNFRAGPGTDCDVIGEPLAAGTAVEVLSEPLVREGEPDLEWVAVSIDGIEGWLATEFLDSSS